MYWSFPVTRARPGATVLARHGDPRMQNQYGRHVLLASQLYGPGRTVFLGFDSTYRWRFLAEDYFDGFWARLIDRVGRNKALGGRFPFQVNLGKSVYRVGDQVSVGVRYTEAAALAEASELAAELEVAGQPPEPLRFEKVPDDPALLTATFPAAKAGAYSLRIVSATASDASSGVRASTTTFRVEPPRREIDEPSLNRPLLADLARLTGGRVFDLKDVGTLDDAIPMREVTRTIEIARRALGLAAALHDHRAQPDRRMGPAEDVPDGLRPGTIEDDVSHQRAFEITNRDDRDRPAGTGDPPRRAAPAPGPARAVAPAPAAPAGPGARGRRGGRADGDGGGAGRPRLVVPVRPPGPARLADDQPGGDPRLPRRPGRPTLAVVAARRALAGDDPRPVPARDGAAGRGRAPAPRPAGRPVGVVLVLAGDGAAGGPPGVARRSPAPIGDRSGTRGGRPPTAGPCWWPCSSRRPSRWWRRTRPG